MLINYMDNELDEDFSFIYIINHLKNNIVGVFLFALAIFIIIFVDYLNRLNTFLYSAPVLNSQIISKKIPKNHKKH